MKFQVYAGSLAVACDAYIASIEDYNKGAFEYAIEREMKPKPQPDFVERSWTGWWLWRRVKEVRTPQPDLVLTREEAKKEALKFTGTIGIPRNTMRIRAIAKHKQSNILLEVTDEEIGDIALYLPDEGKNERI